MILSFIGVVIPSSSVSSANLKFVLQCVYPNERERRRAWQEQGQCSEILHCRLLTDGYIYLEEKLDLLLGIINTRGGSYRVSDWV